jgi:lactoylglutathione lyase
MSSVNVTFLKIIHEGVTNMKMEHIAVWTYKLEEMKDFYVRYFDGVSNEKYHSTKEFAAAFSSYFISFESGTRLEIMQMDIIPDGNNKNGHESTGFTHIAIEADERNQVDSLVNIMRNDGHIIAGEPRFTGDGYYEAVVLDPDGNRVEIVVTPK